MLREVREIQRFLAPEVLFLRNKSVHFMRRQLAKKRQINLCVDDD